ncbi:MAG: hypothetical protein ACOVN5_14000 [Aquidulcibacter sp.]
MSPHFGPKVEFIPANLVLSSDPYGFAQFVPIFQAAIEALIRNGLQVGELEVILSRFLTSRARQLFHQAVTDVAVEQSIAELQELGLSGFIGDVPDIEGFFSVLIDYLEKRFPEDYNPEPQIRCAIDIVNHFFRLAYWARWPLNPSPAQAANHMGGLAEVAICLGMSSAFLNRLNDGTWNLVALGRQVAERNAHIESQPRQINGRVAPKETAKRRFIAWFEGEVERGCTPTLEESVDWCRDNLLIARKHARDWYAERPNRRTRGQNKSREKI